MRGLRQIRVVFLILMVLRAPAVKGSEDETHLQEQLTDLLTIIDCMAVQQRLRPTVTQYDPIFHIIYAGYLIPSKMTRKDISLLRWSSQHPVVFAFPLYRLYLCVRYLIATLSQVNEFRKSRHLIYFQCSTDNIDYLLWQVDDSYLFS